MPNSNIDELMGAYNIHEYREIAVTSKRQITIPKSFFDHLGIENSLVAWLTDDGIYLKPVRGEDDTVTEHDRKEIIMKVLSEGGAPEQMADKINHRLREYEELMDKRIHEFQDDMSGSSDDEGDDGFNGLDVFFKSETGERASETRKERTDGTS